MKVLFVSSGKSYSEISPITKNQGESLVKQGVDLNYFPIGGKGTLGYLKAIPKLRKHLKANNYDIIHAHYSLTAFVASLSGASPLIVSLMGSDVKSRGISRFFIRVFSFFSWKGIIIKSQDMKSTLGLTNVHIIPNGVNFSKFSPANKFEAMKKIGWDTSKQHVLFGSSPNRYEKNFELAKNSFDHLNNSNLQLHCLENIENNDIPYYLNASDVLVLTSFWEGSPNIIKEAMACNVPIVSTDVGDVRNNIESTDGCYIAGFESKDFSEKLNLALNFKKRTNGRTQISFLREETIAKKLINLYSNFIKNNTENATN